METLLESISFEDITDCVMVAKERVIYCAPNVLWEMASVLAERKKDCSDIRVIINLAEENYRNGYGNIASIDILKKANIPIYHMPDNMVSFLITDDSGYFLFLQSELFKENNNALNAVEMDSVMIVRLIAQLFPPKNDEAVSKMHIELASAIEAQKCAQAVASSEIQISEAETLKPIDEQSLTTIRANLVLNPPLAANLKKLLDVYTSKIRFVDLEFTGLQFTSTKVQLPKNALPVSNPDLLERLQTQIQLFSKSEYSLEVEKIRALGEEEKELRKKYLTYLPEYKKSVFRRSVEVQFKKEVEDLRQRIEAAAKQLAEYITEEIENTKKVLSEELLNLYKQNPPPKYQSETVFDTGIDEEAIKRDIQFIVSRIKFPRPQDITGRLTLKYFISDVAIENLRDEKFRKDLLKHGVLEAAEEKGIVKEFRVAEVEQEK